MIPKNRLQWHPSRTHVTTDTLIYIYQNKGAIKVHPVDLAPTDLSTIQEANRTTAGRAGWLRGLVDQPSNPLALHALCSGGVAVKIYDNRETR